MKSDGQIATITIELKVYGDRVEGSAKGMKWNSDHGGKVVKTTPYASHYGPDALSIYYSVLKQALLEATEPQIDFVMETLELGEG